MRSNGIPAARFDVLRDVDQLVSPRLLQLLAEAGIAAYARQRANAVDPTRFDVVDRLWVDATRRDEAAQLVDEHLPALSALLEHDDDAMFAEIISGWDDDGGSPVGAWPVQEDVDPDAPSVDDAFASADEPPTGVRRRLIRPAQQLPAPVVAPEDLDDHFIPLPPPPLPRLGKPTIVGLSALLVGAGFLVVIWLTGLYVDVDPSVRWLALVCALAGGVSLLARMRDRLPPEEGGPDDGAVI